MTCLILHLCLLRQSLRVQQQTKQQVAQWVDSYNVELITEAISRAVNNGVRNFKYFDRILDSWHCQGWQTLRDVKLHDPRNKQTAAFSSSMAGNNRDTASINGGAACNRKAVNNYALAADEKEQSRLEMIRSMYAN